MLDDEDPRIHLHKPHHTHYCNICNVTMSLHWNDNKKGKATGNYITTQADRHIATEHPNEEQAINSNLKSTAKIAMKSEMIKAQLAKVHDALPASQGFKKRRIQTKLPGMLSWRDRAYCKQAHWQIYSKQSPPICGLRDWTFHDMLGAMIPDHCNFTGSIPILTERKLKFYIEAEYNLLKQEMVKVTSEV